MFETYSIAFAVRKPTCGTGSDVTNNSIVVCQDIQRMDTSRIPKQALQYKRKWRRHIGRPRKRWRDQFHLEDQVTGNTPNPSWTWWWWWWWWCVSYCEVSVFVWTIWHSCFRNTRRYTWIPWVLTSLVKWQCRGDPTLELPWRGKLVVQALPHPRSIPYPLKKKAPPSSPGHPPFSLPLGPEH